MFPYFEVDGFSLMHIFIFFIVGVFIFLYFYKNRFLGFVICLFTAIGWELLERVLDHFVTCGVFYELPQNSLYDIIFYDMIGFIFAYLLVFRPKIFKRR